DPVAVEARYVSDQEMPVPGTETVCRTPRDDRFVVKPRPPSERDAPLVLRFIRTPGASLKLFRKRKAIGTRIHGSCQQCNARAHRDSAAERLGTRRIRVVSFPPGRACRWVTHSDFGRTEPRS